MWSPLEPSGALWLHSKIVLIRDVFGYGDSSFNHFLPFQDGEQPLEYVTFSDSHKKPRYEAVNDVKANIYSEDVSNVPSQPRKDGRVLPSARKDGSSDILDLSRSPLPEKIAQALGLTKCSTGSTILDCQEAKISTSSFGQDEDGTGNTTLCSDYPFAGKRGAVHHKKHGDIFSANALASVLTGEQRDGGDDMQFYGCPNIEDFDRMFRNLGSTFARKSTVAEEENSWFSSTSHGFHGMEDTLQSVVLSSVPELSALNNTSCSHGLLPSAINTENLSGTSYSPLPMYSDIERKGKLVLSELACVHGGIVEKSLSLEHIGYGNECRDPNMVNMTVKELYTITGKKVNSAIGSTVQNSLCSCGLINNAQNQKLLSSFASLPQPGSLQAISKENLFLESHASNCPHSYNPQGQMSDILKLQHVFPTLNSSVIESNALLDYAASNNPSSHASQFIGIPPSPFSMPPMPMEKGDEIYARQKFAAAANDSSVHREYKFEDEIEGDRKPVFASGNIAAVNIGSSSSQGNTFLDDMSLKAGNFGQLQMITDRLGVRTKLCIRDSLYRLATSAGQSHYYGAANNVSSGSSPIIGLRDAKDSTRPREISGMSISTNAIERSVAYLLFHKSLESGRGGTADNNDRCPCWQ